MVSHKRKCEEECSFIWQTLVSLKLWDYRDDPELRSLLSRIYNYSKCLKSTQFLLGIVITHHNSCKINTIFLLKLWRKLRPSMLLEVRAYTCVRFSVWIWVQHIKSLPTFMRLLETKVKRGNAEVIDAYQTDRLGYTPYFIYLITFIFLSNLDV